MALSVAGGWETELGVLRAARWRVPGLSPHSAASPAWPVLYKYSRLCLTAVLPPPYHKGAPDGATLGESAAQICWVRIPLLPPHLHMPVWASQILFQARGRKDALGPWVGLAALSGQWHCEATFYMTVASQACLGLSVSRATLSQTGLLLPASPGV